MRQIYEPLFDDQEYYQHVGGNTTCMNVSRISVNSFGSLVTYGDAGQVHTVFIWFQ